MLLMTILSFHLWLQHKYSHSVSWSCILISHGNWLACLGQVTLSPTLLHSHQLKYKSEDLLLCDNDDDSGTFLGQLEAIFKILWDDDGYVFISRWYWLFWMHRTYSCVQVCTYKNINTTDYGKMYLLPKEANWKENSYHHFGRWDQIPTKYVHCQISVERHQSFNNTNATIWTQSVLAL